MSEPTIWKFVLRDTLSHQTVDMPKPLRILSAGRQQRDIVIWAEVVPGEPTEQRLIQVVMTGQRPPLDAQFIDTVFYDDLVFHVYEVIP
ncbi:hypothetical protein MHM88_14520 [Epibacterium sp. MM17-32]|uniref:DUF7352 domain-containing protein n=1 Tax=Epibacterium sp. MM17-32 TaxID=2917734 RepID=UPI001EF55F2A|nr:hypothetical protein [Epibacterium sp. MM17-32]MCG7629022.1 hypothetical protein [Epibacterium sp. MM17-32]